MKRTLKALITTFIFCMMLMQAVNVLAAPYTGTVECTYNNPNKKAVGITIKNPDGGYTEVALINRDGTIVKQGTFIKYASFDGVAVNKVFFYQARNVEYDLSVRGFAPVSDWSVPKPLCTAKIKKKLKSTKETVVILKGAKVSGVKAYHVYASKSPDKGYKKVGKVRPGKKLRVEKFKKKALKKNQNYYLKIVPVLTNGQKAAAITDGFIIETRWS